MRKQREFELGDMLSVTSGRLVSRRHVGGLYDLMGFMTGDSLFTHQLPRAMDSCGPELLRQHPWLADIEIPDWSPLDRSDVEIVKAAIYAWLDSVDAQFGKTHMVTARAPGWQSKDAVAEMDQMMGNRPVLVVRPS